MIVEDISTISGAFWGDALLAWSILYPLSREKVCHSAVKIRNCRICTCNNRACVKSRHREKSRAVTQTHTYRQSVAVPDDSQHACQSHVTEHKSHTHTHSQGKRLTDDWF